MYPALARNGRHDVTPTSSRRRILGRRKGMQELAHFRRIPVMSSRNELLDLRDTLRGRLADAVLRDEDLFVSRTMIGFPFKE